MGDGPELLRPGPGDSALRQGSQTGRPDGHVGVRLFNGQHGQASLRDVQVIKKEGRPVRVRFYFLSISTYHDPRSGNARVYTDDGFYDEFLLIVLPISSKIKFIPNIVLY